MKVVFNKKQTEFLHKEGLTEKYGLDLIANASINIKDGIVENIRDYCLDYEATNALDENYGLTEEGKVVIEIIDILEQ